MRVEEYVAAPDDEREAHLASLDAPGLLRFGVDLYHAGEYWHAHEAWEAAWLAAPTGLHGFYQGLIQLTAAFVHLRRGQYPGAVRLLAAAIEKLAAYPADCMGLDVASLLAAARRALARLQELGEKRVREFDWAMAPRIALLA